MDWQTIGGLVARHALSTAGGWLAAHGYLASEGITGFVGARMVFVGVATSWWQKRGQVATAAELARLKTVLAGRSAGTANPAASSAKA
jgi:hypothetical protein